MRGEMIECEISHLVGLSSSVALGLVSLIFLIYALYIRSHLRNVNRMVENLYREPTSVDLRDGIWLGKR